MPIGNLTSQIFANIYLNEFDRFVKHNLKPKAYVRYGDDFIMIEENFRKLNFFRGQSIGFLQNVLKLDINPKSDKIFKAKRGLKFLGVALWPWGRKLSKRNQGRVISKVNTRNVASYLGIVKHHEKTKELRKFHWMIAERLT
jgi:hypothetical protein